LRSEAAEEESPPPALEPAATHTHAERADQARPDPAAVRVWKETQGELALQMTSQMFATWFKNTRGFSLEEGHLVVAVESASTQDWLDSRMRRLIERTLAYTAGSLSVEFVVAPDIVFRRGSRLA
jgi:hypothetical protein